MKTLLAFLTAITLIGSFLYLVELRSEAPVCINKGVVVDLLSRPLAGVAVNIRHNLSGDNETVYTNAQGHYELWVGGSPNFSCNDCESCEGMYTHSVLDEDLCGTKVKEVYLPVDGSAVANLHMPPCAQ